MLTGDKVETAICIAISTGIKQPNENFYIIKEMKDSLELQNELNEFSKNAQNLLNPVNFADSCDRW
jgi:phospholipid-translocating ATPase